MMLMLTMSPISCSSNKEFRNALSRCWQKLYNEPLCCRRSTGCCSLYKEAWTPLWQNWEVRTFMFCRKNILSTVRNLDIHDTQEIQNNIRSVYPWNNNVENDLTSLQFMHELSRSFRRISKLGISDGNSSFFAIKMLAILTFFSLGTLELGIASSLGGKPFLSKASRWRHNWTRHRLA